VGIARVRRLLDRFLADRRGATAAVITLMIVPIVGAIGMAVEGGSWYLVHRAAQNAADAASVAAAINACAPAATCDTSASATYDEEAAAVAIKFGFTDDASTDIATTMVNCPGTTSPDCYQVQITKRLPVTLVRLVGFSGDTTFDGQPAQTIRAIAIAMPPEVNTKGACIGALATGESITFNGVPGSNINGCDFLSNGSVKCNGNEAWTGINLYTVSGASGCPGSSETVSPFVDPYDALSASIPTGLKTSCTPLTAWTGTKICLGNATLGENIDLTTAGNQLVVNGQLDTAGHTLKTSGSGSLTIMINGPTTSAKGLIKDSAGTIDIKAPTSGTFSGVALMAKKGMTGTVKERTLNLTGNKPVFKVQGLIYVPSGDVNITGAIDKATGGLLCISIVAQNVTIGGGGHILSLPADQEAGATSQCLDAGLTTLPIPGALNRVALVQ
jgi:hypothetical protein